MKEHDFIPLADDAVRLSLRYSPTDKSHLKYLFGVGVLKSMALMHHAEDFDGLTADYFYSLISLEDAKKLRDVLDEVIKEADHEL